ncbi:MAG: hypothetical protein ACREAM_01475, partial [Blastocatellia bacterium]
MLLKKIACLLALALFISSLQACRNENVKSDLNAQASLQNQTSPQPDPQQASATVVPAPKTFNQVFVGSIDNKHLIRMQLERKDADLTGGYFYERAGAFNAAMRTLELNGRIDDAGNVTLIEGTRNFDTGRARKTGEFKGKLDGSSANGDVTLRFSGMWTGVKDKTQMPFSLLQLGYDLGGLKLDEKKQKSANKKLRYEIETALPQLLAGGKAGDDPAR